MRNCRQLHRIAGEHGEAVRLYPTRERSVPERFQANYAGIDSVYGLKLSINEGIDLHGFDAVLSTVKEVKQMLDEDVWEGVESKTLSAQEWKSVISSMLFLKEKNSPSSSPSSDPSPDPCPYPCPCSSQEDVVCTSFNALSISKSF